MRAEYRTQTPQEEGESLWWLSAPPTIWLLHFLACYITSAIWCERMAARDVSELRWLALLITFIALSGLALLSFRSFRRYRPHVGDPPLESDTPESRHRFLGFAGILLSGMSALGVLYVALPFALGIPCR
jgi:hypothetical protein